LFLSTTTNNRDAKGRVSVPADFRAVIAAQSKGMEAAFDGVFVWPSFNGPFLEGGGEMFMKSLEASIDSFDFYDDARSAFEYRIFAASRRLAFDSGGRVSLPNDLAEHASLNGRITFVGLGRRFEIWNPERYEAHLDTMGQVAFDNRHRLKPAIPNGDVS